MSNSRGRATLIRDTDLIRIKRSLRICILHQPPGGLGSWASTNHLLNTSMLSRHLSGSRCRRAEVTCLLLHLSLKLGIQAQPLRSPLPLSLPHRIIHRAPLSLLSTSCHSHCHFLSLSRQSLLEGCLPLVLSFPSHSHCRQNDLPKPNPTTSAPCWGSFR